MSEANGSGSRPGESAPAMRIGNLEREAAVARLQTGLGEGRLDIAEFDQRMTAVYAARTEGELVPLLVDLPTVPGPAPGTSPTTAASTASAASAFQGGPRPSRDDGGRWLQYAWRAWALAVSINVVIWFLVSIGGQDLAYFWPMWVAGPWGAVLLVNTFFTKLR